MKFVNSLKYSMIILGTDQNIDLSKMSLHQKNRNFFGYLYRI